MSRLIKQDGKFFRIRRDRLVQIPPEWVGIVPARNGNSWRLYKKLYRKKEKAQELTKFKEELSEILREL